MQRDQISLTHSYFNLTLKKKLKYVFDTNLLERGDTRRWIETCKKKKLLEKNQTPFYDLKVRWGLLRMFNIFQHVHLRNALHEFNKM